MSTQAKTIINNAPEILSYLGASLAHRLEKEGIDSQKASHIALNMMDVMRKEFGGQLLYFPKGIQLDIDQKAFDILDKFYKGATISELAHEYQHSIQYIYKVIAKARAKFKAERAAQ